MTIPDSVTASSDGNTDAVLDTSFAFRDQIRSMAIKSMKTNPELAKAILQECDRFRDENCIELGILLEDQPNGPATWKREEVERLRKNRAEAKKAAELQKLAAATKKQAADAKKLATAKADLKKLEDSLLSPAQHYQAMAAQYSAFDAATGRPTKDAAGVDLSKGAWKKIEKDWDAKDKAFAAATAKPEATQASIKSLEKQISELEAEQVRSNGAEQ